MIFLYLYDSFIENKIIIKWLYFSEIQELFLVEVIKKLIKFSISLFF